MMRRSLRQALALVASLVTPFGLASSGCQSKAGDPCQEKVATCLDTTTKLTCEGGAYVESPCRGNLGCRETGGKVLCDVSANRAGDLCTTTAEGQGACSPDSKRLIRCNARAYNLLECRGPSGCHLKDDGSGASSCDQSRAEVGDPCIQSVGAACSSDGKQMLECVDGKFAVRVPCRGEAGCRLVDGKPTCDRSRGEIGDPCEPGAACSVDGKQMLTCRDGKLALRRACRGPAGCVNEDGKVHCAESGYGEAGDPCEGPGAACTVALDAILHCKDGTFSFSRACRCNVLGDHIRCE